MSTTYPAVRTEELLLRLRRASLGEEVPAEVGPLVDAVLESTRQTHTTYTGGPSPDPGVVAALEEYLKVLGRVRVGLVTGELVPLEEVEAAIQGVRAAQTAQAAELAAGATVFPFLNRLLKGEDLRAEVPGFLQWLRGELRGRAVSPRDAQLVFQLQEHLEAPTLAEAEVVELASRLAGILSEPSETAPGPTAVPCVNALLGCLDDRGENDQVFHQHLTECRNYLRSAVPLGASEEVLQALGLVMGSLDHLEKAVRENLEFEQLLLGAYGLETYTDSLVNTFVQSTAPPATQEVAYAHGLPGLFQSVLDVGAEFLSGRADEEAVLSASEHLELAASQMQREAEQVKANDRRMDILYEAFELMREASDSLRALASTGDPRSLEFASTLCCQAVERINAAGSD